MIRTIFRFFGKCLSIQGLLIWMLTVHLKIKSLLVFIPYSQKNSANSINPFQRWISAHMLSRQFDPLLTDLLVYAALNVGVNEHGCGSVLNGFYQVMRFISSKLLFSIFCTSFPICFWDIPTWSWVPVLLKNFTLSRVEHFAFFEELVLGIISRILRVLMKYTNSIEPTV